MACATLAPAMSARSSTWRFPSGGLGPTPFIWKVVSGKLPAGLKMARFFGVESTEITGTPTKVGTSTFTVQVKDGATAQQAFSLTIDPPRPLVITSGSCCPAGTVGVAYHVSFLRRWRRPAVYLVDPVGSVPSRSDAGSKAARRTVRTPTTTGTFSPSRWP